MDTCVAAGAQLRYSRVTVNVLYAHPASNAISQDPDWEEVGRIQLSKFTRFFAQTKGHQYYNLIINHETVQ